MESKKINQLATELAPVLSDLTIIGDPTTGISKKITLSQMASLFTGTVEEYASLSSFPLVGTADTIYIALDTNIIYRWNTGTNTYNELSPNIVTSLVFNDANGFDGTISLVGSTATLSITTALTAGSVPFIGASGALSQDNANHYWDNTNKRLGINTSSPTTALDVFGSGIIERINGTSTNNAFLGFSSAGSNKWSIGNVQSDHRFRIYSEANTSEIVSVLQTGEVGIGIANPLTKLHIFGGATALIANLDANTSVAKSISYRSGNSSRINLEVSGTESGSNAGMDFYLRTYTDAGALLATPLTITRSTSAATFASTIAATQLTLSTFASGRNLRLSSNPTGIEFYNTVGTVRNWQISAQSINDQSLDFTPSTANGGTTYTTPLLSLQGVTSRATILGDLLVKKSGAPQAIFSVDGTTGLFFRDGTNAAWKSWQIATSYNDGSDLSFMPSTNTSGTPTWGSSVLVLQGNGRVGIGETSPFSILNIKSGVANDALSPESQVTITNSTSGYFSTLGFRTTDTDGTHGRAGITVSKDSGSVSGKMNFVVRKDSGVFSNAMIITSGSNFYLNTEYSGYRVIIGGATGIRNAIFTNGDNEGYAGGSTAMYIAKNTGTGRSINAAGTFNANGADYAEYMKKSNKDLNFAKGDIIGVDKNGLLTDSFKDSISFVVKSTDPSYVGGDNWFNDEIAPEKTEEQTEEEFNAIYAEWNLKYQEARKWIDRIAFSGQVPCNIYNAKEGDYIIPIDKNGKISGQSITKPTFEQYQIAVGKVWKISEDERAWIAVKIG